MLQFLLRSGDSSKFLLPPLASVGYEYDIESVSLPHTIRLSHHAHDDGLWFYAVQYIFHVFMAASLVV